jgi:hypothetical protein
MKAPRGQPETAPEKAALQKAFAEEQERAGPARLPVRQVGPPLAQALKFARSMALTLASLPAAMSPTS